MIPNFKLIYILLLTFYFKQFSTKAQAIIDLETGVVVTGKNDIRIPNDFGTLFSLKNDLKAQIKIFYRLRATCRLLSRHTISLLYAPLKISSLGQSSNGLLFNDVLFDTNSVIKSLYKFNSYRLTYRYDVITQNNIFFGIGLTAKIRDAYICLYSNKQTSTRKDIGFVPLINFDLLWKINDPLGIILNGDALFLSRGRAADIQLAITYRFSDSTKIRIGYRMLEGGTNSASSYTFAFFHYASLGFNYSF